jgi:homoserine O-succinyltransferase/O-acetyltransferase
MPVELNPDHPNGSRHAAAKLPSKPLSAEFQDHSSNCLTIGLINNMPDGALEATERQFLSLLDAASGGLEIRLSLYALPGVPRSTTGARHIASFYSNADDLLDTHLDGLIVTGREPLTSDLRDEPYWKSFTSILEWARESTHSTVWSCLAAHAATLHMDGIRRIRSDHKRFGIFDCERLSDHPLAAGTSSHFKLPHSRWNGVPEDALTACGYNVLTRSAEVGVDTFVKQEKSLFVFFQGHPEYESDTLLLEYRRDVGRYLRGESDIYPLMPQSYFDQQTANALTALRERALARRQEDLLADVSSALAERSIENAWQSTATRIYINWLQYIAEQKKPGLKRNTAAASTPIVPPLQIKHAGV